MLPQNQNQPLNIQFQEQNQQQYYYPVQLQPQPFGMTQQPNLQNQPQGFVYQGFEINQNQYPPVPPPNYAKAGEIQIELKEVQVPNPIQTNANIQILHTGYKNETHSHFPAEICCPNCHQIVLTIVQYELGLGTWTMVLCLFCFFWPLMCVPCCCRSMQDVVHTCPLCNTFCGRKKFLC